MRDEGRNRPGLVRGLTALDGTLITVGSVVGTGAFLTTSDMARALPDATLILAAWVLGGLMALTGAVTYAELATMMPRAGGPYHFVKEAWGPLAGFLKGWVDFLVIMSGGLAAIAVGFGTYFGSFAPFFSVTNVVAETAVLGIHLKLTGAAIAGVLAVIFFTLTSVIGLRESTTIQNIVTGLKIGAVLALALAGLFAPAPAAATASAAAPVLPSNLASAFGVAMIGVLWTFDGWYAVTYLGGEMKNPGRDLPRSLFGGVAIVTALYVLLNVVYFRALPLSEMAGSPLIAASAAIALFGEGVGRAVSLAVVLSAFGCVGSTILYSTRTYLPMAQDGVFFRALAEVHPTFRTPAACILAQGAWTIVLACSGTYEALYTYVIVILFLFHALIGIGLFTLRARRPEWERPYRVHGYPWVPAIFVIVSLAFVANALVTRPVEAALGFGIAALGVPAYYFWKRTAPA
jgi:APA family basic amino acid/polyamine antiporter